MRENTMRLIERDYLQTLLHVMGTPDIKIITGVRRSGKSKLLEAFIDAVHDKPLVNIIHFNLLLEKNTHLLTAKMLYDTISQAYRDGWKNIVCIDEVQLCKDFEKAVSWLHAEEKYDIYITGSNAFLLSSDLATLFTGRSFSIEVFPFSFAEYRRYFGDSNIYDQFDRYLEEGGMPGSYLYPMQTERLSYIADIYRTLISRDIKQKFGIRNEKLLDNLTDYLMSTIGCKTSIRNIVKELNAAQVMTNNMTIGSYVNWLCNAFLFYRIRRYDIAGKRYLESQDIYYLSDHTFRTAILGTKDMDYGKVLENIVAIELLRRGYEVYVGTLYQKEIDFVAKNRNETLYIQVSDDITNKDTFEREYTPLLAIKEAYPKMILSRTRHPPYDYKGIQIYDIADWLLKKS